MEYVVTLSVTITQLQPDEQNTLLRKISTGDYRGVAAAKHAYDAFLSELAGCLYTEDDSKQTTKTHVP
jgi:hypothetical protein